MRRVSASALALFLERIAPLDGAALIDAVAAELLETGGKWEPVGQDNCRHRITLHGITATGKYWTDVVQLWRERANSAIEPGAVS